MSNEAITWAWSVVGINPGQKLVLVAIADSANGSGWAYPGQETLARKCCMNRSTVNQHVKALETLGLLAKQHRAGEGGHRTSNGYQLHLKGAVKTNVGNSKVGKTNVGFSAPQSWESQQEPSEEPNGYIKPPLPPKNDEPKESGFDRFWKSYPKKKSKGQAEKAWAKLRPSEQLVETMLESIKRAKTSWDWQKEGGQFIPYPASWLNAKGWEDEYEENPAGATTSAPGRAQPQQQKGRTHENYSRPRNRAERCESAWERNVEALERSLAEEAEAELGGRTMDETSCDLRSEVVRLLPRKNARHG